MYKRLTVAQLQQLCTERGIDSGELRHKREYILALEQGDNENDNDDSDNQCIGAAEGNDVESDSVNEYDSDGGQPAESVEDNDRPADRVGEDTVAILQLKLQLAREQRKANEELRKAKESEERLAQERTQRNAQGPLSAGRHPGLGMDIRDVKAFLPTMRENDDILTFVMTFERALELNGIDRGVWARLLPAQLNQKAMQIFTRLSLEESRDYDTAKRAILNGFKLDSSSYLKTFRTMRRTGQSTYKAFLANLREVAARYYDAKYINSFETLHCAFIMEQYLASLPDNVRTFVVSKQPETADQAAEYSDLFLSSRVLTKTTVYTEWEPRGTLA